MVLALIYVGVDEAHLSAHWHGPRLEVGQRFPLASDRRTTVGRATNADIRCFSNAVARLHVAVTVEGDTAVVEDLGSTNGTWIDGTRIARAALSIGQRVALARAFVFELRAA